MKIFGFFGALYGFLGVLVGAFGAHALKQRLPAEMLALVDLSSRYQLMHALALLGTYALMSQQSSGWFVGSGISFCLGIFLFSGSLLVLALTGVRGWGAVTPVGGTLLLLGWLFLLIGILSRGTG